MNPKRTAAEAKIIKYIEKMHPGSPNTKMYKDRFAAMDDKEFHQFMCDLRDKKVHLRIIVPNFSASGFDLKNLYAVSRELGAEPYQRVWIPAKNGVRSYLTPNAYFVGYMPLGRQAQFLEKKISIPKDDRVIDQITGQATGDSKGAKVSAPEAHCMIAMNLENNLVEMMKVKGGDAGAYSAANAYIDRTGEFSIEQVSQYSTGVQSKSSLIQYFRAAHIKADL